MIASTISLGGDDRRRETDLTFRVQDPAAGGNEHEHERAQQL
jgi:hypothetical protein